MFKFEDEGLKTVAILFMVVAVVAIIGILTYTFGPDHRSSVTETKMTELLKQCDSAPIVSGCRADILRNFKVQ